MLQINNVEFYDDDVEIIEILQQLPPLEAFGGQPILRFMQTKTVGADFGTVIFWQHQVYTLYKFDIKHHKPGDAGLLMTTSTEQFCHQQLNIWQEFKKSGIRFGEQFFEQMQTALLSCMAVHEIYRHC